MARVLVISPHPDDEAIGCGGTICAHADAGDDVQVVFLTSGEQGGHGRPVQETAQLREQEAIAASKILSTESTEFWHQPDGQVTISGELIERMKDKLVAWQPEWIYVTHEREMHPDHQAAAALVRRAVGKSGRQAACVVRMYEVWTPLEKMDDIVDISQWMERKLAAVRAHRTQCQAMRFDDAVAGLNRYRGEMHSWPGGDYAEVFLRMQL